MTIDVSSGVIVWYPDNSHVGDHSVTIRVDDGNGGTDDQSFNLNVINVPSNITSSPINTTLEDQDYIYDVECDDEGLGSTTYSLINPPNNMTIDQDTGLIKWVPNNTQVGNHSIKVHVDDGNGGTKDQSFILSVINVPPTITSSPVITATEGVNYICDVESDDEGAGAKYSLNTSPSSDMSIDPNTGVITWDHKNIKTWQYQVEVKVDDKKGGNDTQNYTLFLTGKTPGWTQSFPIVNCCGNSTSVNSSLCSNPVIEVDFNGSANIVWVFNSSSIHYMKISRNGEFLVNDTTIAEYKNGASLHFPRLAIDSKGSAHVVAMYWKNEYRWAIYRKVNPQGGVDISEGIFWHVPTEPNGYSLDFMYPTIAIAPDDSPVIAVNLEWQYPDQWFYLNMVDQAI